ncbi:MAG: prealbumin-like fold domain-containing protein [Oscillospiraceae bacterium]|nr:prealbumin-like fold domain-containing protein [Oscillospiraceae bacterium]
MSTFHLIAMVCVAICIGLIYLIDKENKSKAEKGMQRAAGVIAVVMLLTVNLPVLAGIYEEISNSNDESNSAQYYDEEKLYIDEIEEGLTKDEDVYEAEGKELYIYESEYELEENVADEEINQEEKLEAGEIGIMPLAAPTIYTLTIVKVDETREPITHDSADFEINIHSPSFGQWYWEQTWMGWTGMKTTSMGLGGGCFTFSVSPTLSNPFDWNHDQEIILQISEVRAPSGFTKLNDTFYIRMQRTLGVGVEVELGRAFGSIFIPQIIQGVTMTVDPYAHWASEINIKIEVMNEPIIEDSFDLNIRKTDESGNLITNNSTEFNITKLIMENLNFVETAMGTHETTSEGTIRINDIEVTDEGEVLFRIEETRAPNGYEKIAEAFYIRATIVQDGRRLVVDEIEIGRKENGIFIPDNSIAGVTTSIVECEENVHCKYMCACFGVIVCINCWSNSCVCTAEFYMCLGCWNEVHLCTCCNYVCECMGQVIQVDVSNKLEQEILFNLALRTFVSRVETNGTGVNLNRAPSVTMPNVFAGELIYTFPVEKSENPVQMNNGSIMIQTIRIFNEGTIAGYVNEIINDIPAGLEFLPMHSTNLNYEWVMIDNSGQVTADVSEAVEIRTRYLENNQIDAFDPDLGIELGNPDYRDIQVAFRVTYEGGTGRIIVSRSEIYDAEAFGGGTVGYINLLDEENDTEYMYVVRTGSGNNNEDDGEVKGEYRPEEEKNSQGKGNAISTNDPISSTRYIVLIVIAMISLMVLLREKKK